MSLKSLKFHIKNNDYFGTLATVLSLIKEKSLDSGLTKDDDKAIKKIIDDLMFLQKNYVIVKKCNY